MNLFKSIARNALPKQLHVPVDKSCRGCGAMRFLSRQVDTLADGTERTLTVARCPRCGSTEGFADAVLRYLR